MEELIQYAEPNSACPGSGYHELTTDFSIEYEGNPLKYPHTGCLYTFYAPNAKGIKVQLDLFELHEEDYIKFYLSPMRYGHLILYTATDNQVEKWIPTRFLGIHTHDVNTGVISKWKITLSPYY